MEDEDNKCKKMIVMKMRIGETTVCMKKKDITECLLKDLRTNLIEIKNSFEVGEGFTEESAAK